MSIQLSEQEMHNLAMNMVGKDLESQGFEFIAVNSELKRHPQFVCIDKNKQYYFVIVKVVLLPNNPNNYDQTWMATFQNHASQKNAKVLFAGVGLRHSEKEFEPPIKNAEYLMEYHGVQSVSLNLN